MLQIVFMHCFKMLIFFRKKNDIMTKCDYNFIAQQRRQWLKGVNNL